MSAHGSDVSDARPNENQGGGDESDARPNINVFKGSSSKGGSSNRPVMVLPGTQKYSDLNDEDFEYNMRNKSRGIAVVINNMDFHPSTGMNARSGSDLDRDNLKRTLTYLGFKGENLIVRDNLNWKAMVDLLRQVAHADHTESDCVFVCILSHGDEDHIYGVDGPVTVDTLFKPFKEPGSETLIGKPKIFLLQACRGEQLDEGRQYQQDAAGKQAQIYKIAKESDFLLAYSVVPGYYSWRNCSNGSWFVQAFCDVVMQDGRRLEFVQCLTRVNRMVSYTFESNARPEYMSMKKQSPCITSMLTKALYF